MSASDDPQGHHLIDGLRRRARRRWLWMLAGIAIASGVITPLVQAFEPHHHSQHRHHSTTTTVAVLVVGAVIACGAVAVLVLLIRRGKGIWAAPLTLGLPRRERRQVTRSIRRATPSGDPTLRAVETETAERIVRQARRSVLILGGFAVLEVVVGVTQHHSAAGRAFFYIAGAMFVLVVGQQLFYLQRARRYLAVVARAPEADTSPG